MAGGNQRKAKTNNVILLGTDFSVPNFYDPSNVVSLTTTNQNIRSAVNSIFGSVDLGYKDMLFLTATGRNDWFSTLDPRDNNIFYPSIGASFLLSEAVRLPSWFNYAKVRASWAQVGGGTPAAYVLTQTYSQVPGGGHLGQPLQTPTQTVGTTSGLLNAPNASLKPYTSTTYEAGLEARFLGGRLSAGLAVYNRRTTEMIGAGLSLPSTFGGSVPVMNFGAMRTRGWELALDFSHTFENGLRINAMATLSDFNEKITKLANATRTVTANYEGKTIGEIWGYQTDRLFQESDFTKNPQGKWILKPGITPQTYWKEIPPGSIIRPAM